MENRQFFCQCIEPGTGSHIAAATLRFRNARAGLEGVGSTVSEGNRRTNLRHQRHHFVTSGRFGLVATRAGIRRMPACRLRILRRSGTWFGWEKTFASSPNLRTETCFSAFPRRESSAGAEGDSPVQLVSAMASANTSDRLQRSRTGRRMGLGAALPAGFGRLPHPEIARANLVVGKLIGVTVQTAIFLGRQLTDAKSNIWKTHAVSISVQVGQVACKFRTHGSWPFPCHFFMGWCPAYPHTGL